MFIGHFAVGLGAKKIAPNVSLGLFFMAVQFLDLLWPNLLLLNVEHVVIHPEFKGNETLQFSDYPISHSLLTTIGWSLLFGGLYWLFKRDFKSSLIIAGCVLSHWILDLVVHFPDLPIYPGTSPLMGLGLWAHPVVELVIEIVMLGWGVVVYLSTTKAKNTKGRIVFWVLVALLLLAQVSSDFSPAPASVTALALSAELIWIFVALAFWADGNRTAEPKEATK